MQTLPDELIEEIFYQADVDESARRRQHQRISYCLLARGWVRPGLLTLYRDVWLPIEHVEPGTSSRIDEFLARCRADGSLAAVCESVELDLAEIEKPTALEMKVIHHSFTALPSS